MALLHDIPLVFYGENEAEYGNPRRRHRHAPSATGRYFTAAGQDRRSTSAASRSHDLINAVRRAARSTCCPYFPADPAQIEQKKVEVHYLGYYLKWHPQSCYYYAVEHGGFQASPERTPGTYSKYNSIDDRIDDFHYYTTYIKFGIGRATYDAAQEIRSRDITREEGVALVKRFDGEFPERFAEEIFRYLSIPEKEFPVASQDVRAADHGPRSTSCISPTASARRICGSSKTASGSCVTPSGSTRRWARTTRSRSCRTFA